MKIREKNALAALCVAVLLLASCASAGKTPPSGAAPCSTRYPILLVHGISQRDDNFIPYWGGIPDALRANGAAVFLANHDAWGSVEDNAAKLVQRIAEIRAQTGARKVNIIAHSKGGIESRYAISSLKAGDSVASLTTMNTPHRGAPLASILLHDAPIINQYTSQLIDLTSHFFMRDADPNVQWAAIQLTPEAMAGFNLRNPDDPRVYYQSWTSAIDEEYGAPPYVLLYQLTAAREGPNDGLVSVESAKWGRFRGVIGESEGLRISHSDVHNFIIFPAACEFDAPAFYVDMVRELKGMGY